MERKKIRYIFVSIIIISIIVIILSSLQYLNILQSRFASKLIMGLLIIGFVFQSIIYKKQNKVCETTVFLIISIVVGIMFLVGLFI